VDSSKLDRTLPLNPLVDSLVGSLEGGEQDILVRDCRDFDILEMVLAVDLVAGVE
jgi:hypothetical protein